MLRLVLHDFFNWSIKSMPVNTIKLHVGINAFDVKVDWTSCTMYKLLCYNIISVEIQA